MFKKTIACMVSAVLCASALLSDAQFSRHDVQEQPPAAAPDSTEPGLRGSNSLARYLAQQGNQQQPKPLKAEAAECLFAVTNLEFDRETGLIRAVSSQSEDCSLLVSFADQDHPANIYKTEIPVRTGEYSESFGSADPALLPEYFTVRAQLVNRIGLPVGQPFVLNRFTREMQEILEKDVSDFEPEQVVNFDDDETTNFIVLSGDTVRAETTAVSNTLVSADYDQNIYVFGNIDERIRTLEQGQYFYIQPTDTDIISTNVQEIVIDGDTATITGSGEIGDMFDFIKMEIDTAQTAADSESARSYRSIRVQGIGSENELEQKEEELRALDPNTKFTELDSSFTVSKEILSKKKTFKLTPNLTIETTAKWNCYKCFSYINIFFVAETTISGGLNVKLNDKKDPDNNDGTEPGTEPGMDAVGNDEHLVKFPLFSDGAINIYAFVDVELKIEAELDIAFGKKFTKGFTYDSDSGFDSISFDTDLKLVKFEMKGTLGLELRVGAEVSALGDILTASVAGGICGEASVSTDDISTCPTEGRNIFAVPDSGGADTVHACETCLKEELSIKLLVQAKIEIGFRFEDPKNIFEKLKDKLKFEYVIRKEIDSLFGHPLPHYAAYCSYNSGGDYKGLHFYLMKMPSNGDESKIECPMKAYKTTFHVSFTNVPADVPSEARLKVGGAVYQLDVSPDSELVLYAVPRRKNQNYEYQILINGEEKAKGSFTVTDAVVDLYDNITWQQNDDGSTEIVCSTGKPVAGPSLTTTTTAVTEEPEPVFDYSDRYPAKYMITPVSQYYDLGENISGMFSNDGTFNVIGYGDMYGNASVPESIRAEIRTVIFEDLDPDSGLYINDIASGLFMNAKALEKVYMPQRLKQIGSNAFKNCTNLKYLRYGGENDKTETFVLPETLESVGESAFSGCSAAVFGELTVPQSVLSVGAYAFGGCNGITALDVPGNGQTAIGMSAFGSCTNLRKAVIGSGVRTVDAYTFGGSNHVEALTVPFYSVTHTDSMPGGISAFFSSTPVDGMYKVFSSWHVNGYVPETLTTVTVTGGTEVPEDFFAGMTSLRTLNLPADTAVIGRQAFKGCVNLDTFTLPQNLTEIRKDAFSGCKTIPFGELTVPETVSQIGANAFSGCAGITALNVPGSGTTTIGMSAFGNCANLRKAELGSGVQTVQPFVFSGCGQIAELTIPFYSVAETDLQPPGISAYFTLSPDAGMYQVFSSFRVNGYIPETLKKVTVLSGDTVPGWFFAGMNTLESVTVSRDTKCVEENAFNGCEALAEARLYGTRTNNWDHVDIRETGNEPLLRLVRRQHPDGYHPGDANGDGMIDVSDAVLIARFAVGDSDAKITDLGVINADVNGDGTADLEDITLILQFIAKRISVFPVNETE
ncbi:MAG: leucine-rich repeat protein [Oscillospiraceae bacterium]|nr:leucine-rich repeat protein [Oscillospiraceae bacterium]